MGKAVLHIYNSQIHRKGVRFYRDHLLAIISMVGYRVRQPARLVVQAIILRNQPHSNGAPDATVHNRHLEGRKQGTVIRDGQWNALLRVGRKGS